MIINWVARIYPCIYVCLYTVGSCQKVGVASHLASKAYIHTYAQLCLQIYKTQLQSLYKKIKIQFDLDLSIKECAGCAIFYVDM